MSSAGIILVMTIDPNCYSRVCCQAVRPALERFESLPKINMHNEHKHKSLAQIFLGGGASLKEERKKKQNSEEGMSVGYWSTQNNSESKQTKQRCD